MKIKQFEFNLFGVNTYVVWDEATLEAAVIDPGMSSPAEEKELADFIVMNKLQIISLINTHLHIDHTLGDEFVEARYGVGLTANSSDSFLGQNRAAQARMFHLSKEPDGININVEVKNGDKLYFGEQYLEVIEVPGHSPGSIALYAPKGKFVITGDALFAGSIGRTDLPGGDFATLIGAIRSRLLSLPADTTVYPGHGPATTIGRELSSNPYIQ